MSRIDLERYNVVLGLSFYKTNLIFNYQLQSTDLFFENSLVLSLFD